MIVDRYWLSTRGCKSVVKDRRLLPLPGTGEEVSDQIPVEVRPLFAGVREVENNAIEQHDVLCCCSYFCAVGLRDRGTKQCLVQPGGIHAVSNLIISSKQGMFREKVFPGEKSNNEFYRKIPQAPSSSSYPGLTPLHLRKCLAINTCSVLPSYVISQSRYELTGMSFLPQLKYRCCFIHQLRIWAAQLWFMAWWMHGSRRAERDIMSDHKQTFFSSVVLCQLRAPVLRPRQAVAASSLPADIS